MILQLVIINQLFIKYTSLLNLDTLNNADLWFDDTRHSIIFFS